MHHRRLGFLFLLLLLTSLPDAHASVVRRIDLDTMTRDADLAFVATVRERYCHHPRAGSRAIQTTTTFDIEHVMKGRPPVLKGFKLTVVGGELDGYIARIPGMPQFKPGQRVVVFLQATSHGYALVGLDQGRFLIEEEDDGRLIAARRVSSALADPSLRGTVEGASQDLRVPLTDLIQQVEALHRAHEAELSPEVRR